MKPFNELTRRGKLRRLRNLAVKALTDYDLRVQWIKFLADDTNISFKVRSVDGENFVLRIYSDEETTLTENQAEVFWLQALKRDTDLNLAEPVPRKDGESITLASVDGVPGEKRCILFKWVPGRVLEKSLIPQNYFKLGVTMAKMHDHAEALKPLPDFIQPKKWDRAFYYPNEPVVYNDPAFKHLFGSQQIALIDQVIALADAEFTRLYADHDGQILIHGDLHYWNVNLYQGELYIMDFEDVMLGYPVQDVAITLYYGRHRDDYRDLREAFQHGYTSGRQWPVDRHGQIETLQAARMINFINYVARIYASPQEYIEARCAELVQYLQIFG
ncbi:MAG: phosphotransferase [Anaerolineales bacterium]|nr:phosphotransferase [Anaerolineales bacterium]